MRYKFEPGTIQTGFDCQKKLGPTGAFAVIVDRVGRADTVAHAITLGHTEDLAFYRAGRLAALLSFSQMLTARELRQLARLAESEDWRWLVIRTLIRSVADIPEHPNDLDT